MEDKVSGKLIRQLRSQVNDLAGAVQLLTPLVTEHGGKTDLGNLTIINRNLYQLVRTVFHLELCESEDHAFFSKPIDVADLCRELGREVETVAERLGVSFTWRLEKESILSVADEELLKLAILNMLTNAFQAAEKGGGVWLYCGAAGGKIRITVSDNGEGLELPEEDENPLLSTDSGLGLGLETARRIAALHGGQLLLVSPKDGGVRSTLFLPIRKPEKSERVRGKEPPGISHLGGYSPLLVEFSPLLSSDSYRPEDID